MLKMWGGQRDECVRFRHGVKKDIRLCLVYGVPVARHEIW